MSSRSSQQKLFSYLVKSMPVIFLMGILLLLTACGGNSSTPDRTSTAQAAATQATEFPTSSLPTRTPAPTATPAPPRLIFLAPEHADQDLVGQISQRLEELAIKDGFLFEKRSTLSPQEISPDVKIVAAIAPVDHFQDLAAAAPQAQFLGIQLNGLTPGTNLSLIGSEGLPAGRREFLAGAIAALVSNDWRTGIILPEGAGDASVNEVGFRNGMAYFCGLCRPALPPYVAYPSVVQLAPGAAQEAVQTVVDSLVAQAVNVVYVSPPVEDSTLFQALSTAGIQFIAGSRPTPDLQQNWAASLLLDPLPALEKIWPDLVQGKSGQNLPIELSIQPGNPAILTPGREIEAKKIFQDLLNGFIDPGTQAR